MKVKQKRMKMHKRRMKMQRIKMQRKMMFLIHWHFQTSNSALRELVALLPSAMKMIFTLGRLRRFSARTKVS